MTSASASSPEIPASGDEVRATPVTTNLVPRPRHEFTREETLRGARAGAVERTRGAAERRKHVYEVYRLIDDADREGISTMSLAAALVLIENALAEAGSVPVETTLDVLRLMNAAETAYRISRLASDQSTSNVAHNVMTPEERRARLAELRGMNGDGYQFSV